MHRYPPFDALAHRVSDVVWAYLEALGFDRTAIALHLQRSWPVVSDWDQVVGRHHHPNAHLSAVLYLSGDGGGGDGPLCLYAPQQLNELVPGLAVGHGGPISHDHPCNQQQWMLSSEPGLLVLFPSRLLHSVAANETEDVLRVSVSFDFVLTARAAGRPPEYLSPHPNQWQRCQRPVP